MVLIREFETMLDEIKRSGKYRDMAYVHQGPAHLSIGQEAAAVGEAFLLTVDDHIYGSHRSHGEILAKGLSAIHKLGERTLQTIMREYLGGDTLRVVEKEPAADVKDLAVNYLLYGLLAEIFARATGFNRGLGGSMHAFFPPFGIYPNNAIVGGSGDIAVGSALYKKTQRRPGITIANIGDASSGCGPVWEGMHFATMGQYWTLWEPDYRGGLPIIFAFMDNFYGMGGQTRGETMGFERLATIAAGLNRWNFHAETVDGNNPLAVIDAIRRKKARSLARARARSCWTSSPTDRAATLPAMPAPTERAEELEAWKAVDALQEFRGQILAARRPTRDAAGGRSCAQPARRSEWPAGLAVDLTISPRLGE